MYIRFISYSEHFQKRFVLFRASFQKFVSYKNDDFVTDHESSGTFVNIQTCLADISVCCFFT